ncbi:hypothetical protein ACN27F_34280 [Solwaraspora sp. WMMB335]|uniref:hypothetical protein n=1 Tax=Solwaraspora sp. WMMB335 TaxID=3404118 RepID=UPI003B938993
MSATTAAGGTAEHLAQRPSWRCRVCADPWPCRTAREQLVHAYDRIGLCLYLADRLIDAVADGLGPSPAGLYHRFLGWARTAHRDPADRPTSTGG